MSEERAAFRGTWHCNRPVVSRGEMQIVINIPQDQQRAVREALGDGLTPPSGETVWLAIARLGVEE